MNAKGAARAAPFTVEPASAKRDFEALDNAIKWGAGCKLHLGARAFLLHRADRAPECRDHLVPSPCLADCR